MSIGDLGTRLRLKRKMAGSGSVVEQVALLKYQEFELFKANLMEPTLKRDKTEVQNLVIPETSYGFKSFND